MDNQQRQYPSYLPGPPPIQGQGGMGYNVPPPPRLPGPPPMPGSQYSAGTVLGMPPGWNQSYGRPPMRGMPPPPPMQMHQSHQNHQYNTGYDGMNRSQNNMSLPPPPSRPGEEPPLNLSATFIPSSQSFGPGVGIPALDEFANFTAEAFDTGFEQGPEKAYDPSAYAANDYQTHQKTPYSNMAPSQSSIPTSVGPDPPTRENRAASASSQRPKFPQLRENPEPLSPGPPTATLVNPHPGRPRAQSAMVPQNHSTDLANQWPLERILIWLAHNDFSHEWQETFRVLRLEKTDFLDLGRSTDRQSNLRRWHQYIFPQLQKICSQSGIDNKKERDDAKRLQRLVAGILQDGSAGSAGSGHQRRESGLTSPLTDGILENSPYLGGSVTPSTTGPEGSPARSHFGPSFSQRAVQERSSTLPVFPKQSSNGTTPADARNADSFGPPANGRGDYMRGVLNGINYRGRHSPNLSGDAGITMRQEGSPGASPALGHSLPSQAQSQPHLPLRDPNKAQSADSFQKATGYTRNSGPGNIVTTDIPLGAGRFYENQKDRTEVRPDPHRTYSSESHPKDHGKGRFFDKFLRSKKHDPNDPTIEEVSPTSPKLQEFRQKLPFKKPHNNHSDPNLLTQFGTSRELPEEDTGPKCAPKRWIFVTPDYWNYRLIDVTNIESAIGLRNKISVELGVSDGEYAQIFFTEPGRLDHDAPLTDAMLAAARSQADPVGSLKFFVKSPTLSAVSLPPTDGLGVLSSGNRRDTVTQQTSTMTDEEIKVAGQAFKDEAERKRMQYLENRQIKRGQTSGGATPVFDFGQPSPRFFEETKPEAGIIPHRKPPPAPSASHTLEKVNSLRLSSQRRSRQSMDKEKRVSDLPQEEHSPRQKSSFNPAGGIAAAVAGSTKIAVLPAAATDQRSPWSVTIGQTGLNSRLPLRRDTTDSPFMSIAADTMHQQGLDRKQSVGPDLDFKETNVQFASSPNPQASSNDDSDDDSDDGLFAVPMRKPDATPKKTEQRPALTLDTDQPPGGKRKVAFKTPTSNDGGSAGAGNIGDDSAGTIHSDGNMRSMSSRSDSCEDRSPEEGRGGANRKSFISDTWADRPAPESMVENLEQYFPGLDVDKPYLEDGGDASPMSGNQNPLDDIKARLGASITFGTKGLPLDFSKKNDSDTLGSDESTLKANQKEKIASVASRQMNKTGGLGRMKSIREVAKKANDVHRGPSVAYRAQQAALPVASSNMIRRKSTKMFGANIVQIKPQRGNRLSTLEPIAQEDVPTEDTPKRQATFKIIRGQLIGKGTYGRVYLGMNATTGDFLAVKQVEVNQRASAGEKDRIHEMVKALDQEIETMSHLEHPNIVQYLGFERQEYSMSIYLEYISGGSVGSCLRKHGKFEEPVVKSLTIQTLSGLKYLHQESILHRDLKADNLLLDLDGTCKISDFGISKKSDNIYGDDVTNSMQGSVFWMAPEVVRTDGKGYSAKVDIWSLGCVVLEMLAGKRPWSREEAIGAIFKLGSLKQAPPIPEDVQQTATLDGLAFMYDCFQISPLDRPTAETLLRHSAFCKPDPGYNFFDTDLAAKLRNANLMPQT